MEVLMRKHSALFHRAKIVEISVAVSPQQAQIDAVGRRIRISCRRIWNDILANYDPVSGQYKYPHNGGRVNQSEILRRATDEQNRKGVAKKTIRFDYHKPTRRHIARFLKLVAEKLSHELESQENAGTHERTSSLLARLSELAQRNEALELRNEVASDKAVNQAKVLKEFEERQVALESEVQVLVTANAILKRRVVQAEALLNALRGEVDNVVPLHRLYDTAPDE